MVTITQEAKNLVARLDSVIETCRARISEAQKSDPYWKDWSAEKQAELLQARKEKAAKENLEEIHNIENDIGREINLMNQEAELKLLPLINSKDREKREEGRYFEQKARDAVKASGMEIDSEYVRAMQRSQIDYATELIHWATLLAGDDPKMEKKFSAMQRRHEEALGASEYLDTKTTLEHIAENFSNWKAIFGRTDDPYGPTGSVVERVFLSRAVPSSLMKESLSTLTEKFAA